MKDSQVKFYCSLPAPSRAIRQAVFVEEQGFTREFDETDERAVHALMLIGGLPAATARITREGGNFMLGRVALKAEYRGRGLGKTLIAACEREARSMGAKSVFVRAQLRAQGFYTACGFLPLEEMSEEDGVPHILMEKIL